MIAVTVFIIVLWVIMLITTLSGTFTLVLLFSTPEFVSISDRINGSCFIVIMWAAVFMTCPFKITLLDVFH